MQTIVGAFGSASVLKQKVAAMAAAVSADGKRSLERFSNDEIGCHVAWTAETQHGGPAHAPAWYARGQVRVLLIGEEHSARSGAAEEMHAASARVHALYEELGPPFAARLTGCLNGILVDSARATVFLFNDVFGLARIYCRSTDEGFFFASEAKALLAVFEDSRSLDNGAVGEMISVGCVLRHKTLYPGIEYLPPSTIVSCERNGRARREQFLSPSAWGQEPPLGEDDFREALRDTFRRLVPKYVRGAPHVAMSLTGGLDGRMIMAWAGARPGGLPCYSFSGPYRESYDVRIAREIATACAQPHQVIPVGRDFLDRFPDLASETIRASDGTMDVSGAVELYVNQKARAIAPVRVTGNYGSEIMRGNVAFRPRRWANDLFEPEIARAIVEAEAVYKDERRGDDLSFIAFKQVPWHHHSRYSVEKSQLIVRSPFLDTELVSLMYRAPRPLRTLGDAILQLIHDGSPKLAAIPTDRSLRYGRRSMVNRVRGAFREFTAKVEYAFDYGMPQSLTRVNEWLRPFGVERWVLGRHKFYHFRSWYRGPLAPYVKDVLLNSQANGLSIFRPGILRSLVERHAAGRANHTLEIHLALSLALTERALLRGP